MSNTKELFANNARTSLAGSLTAISTSIVLQTGAGALFPSPNNAIGEFAKATLQDAATGTRNEIVYITARTGDVLTVTRGQDGTSAQVWSAGDTIFEGVTANTLANFTQPSDVQKGAYNYAEAAGTTTAYTATYSPAITAINDGMPISLDITSVGTNTTTTPTLAVNGLTAWTIVKDNGTALQAGDIPDHAHFQADSSTSKWVLLNPRQLAASETISGTLKLATQTQANTGTDDATAITPLKLKSGFSISLAANGYIVFPTWASGLIVQWGAAGVTGTTGSAFTYPLAFPSAAYVLVGILTHGSDFGTFATAGNAGNLTQGAFRLNAAVTRTVNWIAIGK